jgi:hypothetical protein
MRVFARWPIGTIDCVGVDCAQATPFRNVRAYVKFRTLSDNVWQTLNRQQGIL